MIDPLLPLQRGVSAALAGDTSLQGYLGSDPPRVFDRVPKDPTFPYVTIGKDELVPIGDECHDLAEVFAHVHVWSRAPGAVEAKQIAALVAAILDVDLAVTGHTVRQRDVRSTRVMSDPDGLTTHAIVTVRYILEAT
jgi:hypothetical protein